MMCRITCREAVENHIRSFALVEDCLTLQLPTSHYGRIPSDIIY